MSSTDSSSDEETSKRISESVIDVSTLVANNSTASKRISSSIISNTQADSKDDWKNNPLGTTPEFRDHVARKLSKALDEFLDVASVWNDTTTAMCKQTDSSEHCVELVRGVPLHLQQNKASATTHRRRRRVSSSSSGSSEDERLRQAAVTSEFVLSSSGIHKQEPVNLVNPACVDLRNGSVSGTEQDVACDVLSSDAVLTNGDKKANNCVGLMDTHSDLNGAANHKHKKTHKKRKKLKNDNHSDCGNNVKSERSRASEKHTAIPNDTLVRKKNKNKKLDK